MSTPMSAKSGAAPLAQAEAQTDWAGLWFLLIEELSGEFTSGRIGRPVAGTGEIAWRFSPHAFYDGVGTLAHVLPGLAGDAPMQLPTLNEKTKPSLLARSTALLRFLAQRRRISASWITLDCSWHPPVGVAGPGTAIATKLLDRDRTKCLVDLAREQGISVNSLLLAALGRASQPSLGRGPAIWMVPVNMRGPVALARETANHTAYLQIETGQCVTSAKVHEQVRRALRRREHWGTWLFLNAGRIVGRTGLRCLYLCQMARYKGRPFVGAFSNLGRWDGYGAWFVCPPVARSCPVGVGAGIWDGRLSLTIEAHPSIARDAAWSRALMDHWMAELGI